jgi:non-heme chloroperoxidase
MVPRLQQGGKPLRLRRFILPYIQVGTENSGEIKLHYEDHGSGDPVVLIHGFPLCGAAWEKQIMPLLEAGRRVITYDRRGFGNSSQPTVGYDYNTFADDLNQIMTQLDLKNATLMGHSMGTGEVVRYLSRYGSERVENTVLVSPLQPYLLKTDDNPDGLDRSVFEGFQEKVVKDRFAFLDKFLTDFYSSGILKPSAVSDQAFQNSFTVGAKASAKATHDCIATWMTDFRQDLPKLDVPCLIVQGTADKIIPFKASGALLGELIKDCKVVPVDGAPHSIPWTHAEDLNRELLEFIGQRSSKISAA